MSRHPHAAHGKGAHPHEKPHHQHWPLTLLLFGFVFALGLASVHETATWLHLATGKWIANHMSVPGVDPFSYTVVGRPWSTDSWLADLVFYAVDKTFGPGGVIALKSTAVALGFALLLPLNPASPLLAAGVLSLAALASWTGFTERPVVFDLLMLALMIRVLRPRSSFHWKIAAQIAVIELLWVNLHGTTAVFGLWLIVLKVLKAAMRTEKRERLNYLGLLLVAWAALLCNPHGVKVVVSVFSGTEASATAWQPLSSWFNATNVFLFAGAAACAVTLQQEFFLTMTAASLVALGFLIPEMRPVAVLGVCPAICLALGHFVARREDTPKRVLRFGLVLAGALAAHWAWVYAPLASSRGYPRNAMDGALQYLSANDVRGRLFNEPAAGGMIVASGKRPVFVDERRALYGADFLRDAESWPQSFSQLSGVYGFDYALLLNRRAGYPAAVIDREPGWHALYADDYALVYARKSGVDGWLVPNGPRKLLAPNQLWPDSLEAALSKPVTRARALAELDAWIIQVPDAVQPLLWKAFAFDLLKLPSKAERHLALAEARRRLKGDPELLACLGYVRERRGDTAAARGAYGRALLLARRRLEHALAEELERRLAALP